jgi:prepilin-type N-terminal cleavage/methylation domain-containing protein
MNGDAMKEREPAVLHLLRVAIRPHVGVPGWERAFLESGTSFPERPFMTLKKQRGFSLLELMITLAIGLTMASVTFIALMPLFTKNHIDVGYDATLMILRNTRHLAITQSHQYVVTFAQPGTITVTYQPPAVAGILPAPQLVSTYTLPPDVTFNVAAAGFPTTTPDGFGTGVQPIDFGQGLGAGSLAYVSFMPDGSSQDTLGNFNSGILYLSRLADNTQYTSRSITVWGATGRIRGWRLFKQAGSPVWVQQ